MKNALKAWLSQKTTKAALLAFISQGLKLIPCGADVKVTVSMGADLFLGFIVLWLASGYSE